MKTNTRHFLDKQRQSTFFPYCKIEKMLYFICINIKNTYLSVLTYTVYTEYFCKKISK